MSSSGVSEDSVIIFRHKVNLKAFYSKWGRGDHTGNNAEINKL
ncbi:rCG22543 [Rattus norvegicus]|uniref:RCG22543 n=1 Tax=Rattus norvegicus TaxID=10116 RepID=A6IPG0_RAT|nr:rCG22543 [Rattus norvegicus]